MLDTLPIDLSQLGDFSVKAAVPFWKLKHAWRKVEACCRKVAPVVRPRRRGWDDAGTQTFCGKAENFNFVC